MSSHRVAKSVHVAFVVLLALTLFAAGCGVGDGEPLSEEDLGFETCNGMAEEGCACEEGQVESCYSDGPNEDGECLEGTRFCEEGGWSECDFTNAGVLPIIGDPELCGGCDPACFRQHTCPTGRDLTEDNAENVRFDLDRDGLVLGGRTVSARFAYIANSGENTVSKIDLGTRAEVGRYYVGGSPSRTAVDSRGNCVVAMRGEHYETVVKIAGDMSYCIDRNHNGRIDTSSGSNVLGRGNDECVIWSSTAAVGACPRAVAIDRRDRIWIGGWCIRNFYVLNSDTGALIRTVPISASAYGAAIDSNGMLWYSGRSHGWLQNVNTETYAVGPVRGTGCGGDLYGIMVDLEDRPWIVCAHNGCRASRFTPTTGGWSNVCSIPYPRTARGITIDSSGDVWIATHHNWGWNYGQGYGYQFNPETLAQRGVHTVHGCDGAIGIASDFEDNMWFACHGSWTGSALDPDTGAVTNTRVGRYPYTYSDFTGFLRATVTAPEGSYKQLFDAQLVCDDDADVVWSQLYFEVETPESTRINFYGRTANRVAEMGGAREMLLGTVPGDEEPLDIQGTMSAIGVPNGLRYYEIRVQLQSLDGETSPVFRNMDLVYYCVIDRCANGEQDGRETDVDCGGAECDPCDMESECERDRDCATGNCEDGECGSCADGSCPGENEYCIDEVCQLAGSCLEIRAADSDLPSGSYVIDPEGNDQDPMTVHCDMSTDGGGYTFLKVDYTREANARQAEIYCADRGMQLFIPRTQAHRNASVDIIRNRAIGGISTDNFMRILGIYPIRRGAGCSRIGFNDQTCTNWDASDDRPWFVSRRTDISEPNGDNGTDSSQYYSWQGSREVSWYNDINPPGYTSRYFMCDVGDKWGLNGPGGGCNEASHCTTRFCNDGVCDTCDADGDCGGRRTCEDGQCRAPSSCLELRRRDPGADSGTYEIYPEDSEVGPVEVYCDMETDGGGYTYLKVDNGGEANAAQAEAVCADRGMQLFITRTEAHRNASVDVMRNAAVGGLATDNFMRILGIYPNHRGAGCSRIGFNDQTCTSWDASDDRPWFVSWRTDITEPNGDNGTTSSQYYSWRGDREVNWYNDINPPGYTSRYFMCDVGDKWGLSEVGDGCNEHTHCTTDLCTDGSCSRCTVDADCGGERMCREGTCVSCAAGIRCDNILGHWQFQGNYRDSSPNALHGSESGTTRLDSGTGVGTSVRFDGRGSTHASRGWVALPNVNPRSAITVSAWVRSATPQYLGVWQMVSHYSTFILGTGCWDCNTMCFIIHDGSWQYGSCYAVPDVQRWHHFVGTYDARTNQKHLYVDGVLRSTTNPGGREMRADGGPVDLGHRECCDHGNFNGWMDEVIIYDRALTGIEVGELYRSYDGRIR